MSVITSAIRSFIKNEEGIAATEYAMLLGLIALLLVAVVGLFGDNLSAAWSNVSTGSFSQRG